MILFDNIGKTGCNILNIDFKIYKNKLENIF